MPSSKMTTAAWRKICFLLDFTGTSSSAGGSYAVVRDEALIQLQKETIESSSVGGQPASYNRADTMRSRPHNQTIANLNETVEYLKKKLFIFQRNKKSISRTDGFVQHMVTVIPVPEPALEEAVGGYKRKAKKPKATREEILVRLCSGSSLHSSRMRTETAPTAMLRWRLSGKRSWEELRIIPAKVNGSICPGSAWLSGNVRKRRRFVIVNGNTKPAAEAQPGISVHGCLRNAYRKYDLRCQAAVWQRAWVFVPRQI